jgi:hypothetical protein
MIREHNQSSQTAAQKGFFVIADISGYTSYLANNELEHARGRPGLGHASETAYLSPAYKKSFGMDITLRLIVCCERNRFGLLVQ